MQIANQEIENLEKIYVIAVEFFISNLPGELISGRSWARRTKQNAKIDQHFGHFAPASGREEAESIRYIDDPSYRRYLEDQLRPKLFDFVFEEASECGPTIAEDVATTLLGQGHYLDVDPHPDNRASFGIPALRNSYTPIIPYEPGNGDFVQHEDLEGQEKCEELWVRRVKEQSFNWALFICGYLHSLSLSFRLRSAGISVTQVGIYMPFHKLGNS